MIVADHFSYIQTDHVFVQGVLRCFREITQLALQVLEVAAQQLQLPRM